MEDDINSSSSSMLPVALAVLAIFLGGAGLYFGLTANQRVVPITESVDASITSTARIEKQLDSFETKFSEISVQVAEMNKTVTRLRTYSAQSEQVAKQALEGVKSNREELVKAVEKFNQLATGGLKPKASTPAATSQQTVTYGPAATNSTSSASEATAYSIQSGDTLAKIATRLSVPLQALLDANPGVDPTRLQIGQKINIPGN